MGPLALINVGNAFTPQGSCDPLSIDSLGVGVYQAGTKVDAQVLYDCVSSGAKASIGYPQSESLIESGASADFVLVCEEHSVYGDQLLHDAGGFSKKSSIILLSRDGQSRAVAPRVEPRTCSDENSLKAGVVDVPALSFSITLS